MPCGARHAAAGALALAARDLARAAGGALRLARPSVSAGRAGAALCVRQVARCAGLARDAEDPFVVGQATCGRDPARGAPLHVGRDAVHRGDELGTRIRLIRQGLAARPTRAPLRDEK